MDVVASIWHNLHETSVFAWPITIVSNDFLSHKNLRQPKYLAFLHLQQQFLHGYLVKKKSEPHKILLFSPIKKSTLNVSFFSASFSRKNLQF